MNRRHKVSIAAAIAVLACCAGAGRAFAAGYPPPALTWSHGQMNGGARFGSDNLNLGFGARGGYTLQNGIYLGGLFDYFIGQSQSATNGGTTLTASAHLWQIGFEGGFDFALTDVLMVRPFLGVGIAEASGDVCIDQIGGAQCMSVSSSDSFIEFGGLLNYMSGSLMFGGDLRILAASGTAVVIGGHIGWLF
jgi:hypothetical protein